MAAPTPDRQPTYYTARRSRRGFLIAAVAALLAAGGGVAVWGSGLLVGADDTTDGELAAGGRVDSPDDEAPAPDAESDADSNDDELRGFESVAMVGDSITQGSTPSLETVLADRGYSDVRIDGKHSRRIDAGNGKDAPLSGVRTLFGMIGEGVAPEAWVIALGTNDVGQYADEDDYRELIDKMVTMLPEDVPLVWVDVYRPDHLEASQLFNQLLRDRLDERGNAVVADWYSRASDPDLGVLRSDQVHPNARGQLVFADLVAEALAELA